MDQVTCPYWSGSSSVRGMLTVVKTETCYETKGEDEEAMMFYKVPEVSYDQRLEV